MEQIVLPTDFQGRAFQGKQSMIARHIFLLPFLLQWDCLVGSLKKFFLVQVLICRSLQNVE